MDHFSRELQVTPMPEFFDAPETDVVERFAQIARLTSIAWNISAHRSAAIRQRVQRLLLQKIPHIHS